MKKSQVDINQMINTTTSFMFAGLPRSVLIFIEATRGLFMGNQYSHAFL